MSGWNWLEKTPSNNSFVVRVVVKAILLFFVANVVFAAVQPLSFIGSLSVYGWLVPFRERLPYGENPDAYNLSTNDLSTLFATHAVSRPKASDEFRVFIVGDSATWGILLKNEETTAGYLNAQNLVLADGRKIVAYNLGHPIMSVTKDLMLLDFAKRYQPDLVVWVNTLESFPQTEQLAPPIVQNNAPRIQDLIARYDLSLNPNDTRLKTLSFFDQTIVGQRRPLADWLRLQLYGVAWSTTHIDQVYGDYTPRSNDFVATDFGGNLQAFHDFDTTQALTTENLSFDVLEAGVTLMGDTPILFVNEPIFIADGENSETRYNFWYPKWAYDQFLGLYETVASEQNWHYINLWDGVPASEFTDSPVHLTPKGSEWLAGEIGDQILTMQP